MAEKLSDKIYKKDFKVKAIGYDSFEVDNYLDNLNIEVEKLEKEMEDLKEKLERSEINFKTSQSQVCQLQIQLNDAKATKISQSSASNGASNLEMLQRISKIEKSVATILNKLDK